MEDVSNFWPAMAVPTTVKMPDPITAPMPSAVKDTGPRVFFNLRSGSCESEISLSMDLQQNSWLPELSCSPTLGAGRLTVGGCANGAYLLSAAQGIGSPSSRKFGAGIVPAPQTQLSLRCTASQLLHFALLRAARVLTFR